MLQRLRDLVRRAGEMIQSLSLAQRLSIGFLVLTILVSFGVLVTWTTRSEFVPLFYRPLEPEQKEVVLATLDEAQTPYRIEGEMVLVPESERDRLVMALSSDEHFADVENFFDWLFEENLTDTQQRVDLKYTVTLQEKLERMISALQPVRAARVQIVPGRDNGLFDRPADRARASVVVDLAFGHRELPPQAVAAIANLVSGAVRNLEPQDVQIVDSRTSRPYEIPDRNETSALAGRLLDQQRQWEEHYRTKILDGLHEFLGHPVVLVNVSLLHEARTEDATRYDPDNVVHVTAVEETISERESTPVPAVVGVTPNVGVGTPEERGERTYNQRQEQFDNRVPTTRTQTQEFPGRPESITCSIIIPVSEVPGLEIDIDRWEEELVAKRDVIERRRREYQDVILRAIGQAGAAAGAPASAEAASVEVLFQPYAVSAPVEQPITAWERLHAWLLVHGNQAFLGVLAIVALGLIFSIVKRTSPKVEIKPVDELLAAMRAAETARRPEEDLEIPTLSEDKKSLQIKDQVRKVISDNPRMVANMLKDYMKSGL